jgi:ABC-type multidrug transport system fused ATPase/permease subunit
LFRLITQRSGCVRIDGLDISSITLRSLRSALSVIPQDPLLFQAPIRINLDPYGSVSDARLWAVLGQCQLGGVVRELPGGLDFLVSDGGTNFSCGQKQLFCLARALVRGSKIVVMDEATAALDFETDQLMRKLVQEHFAHATLLTIAHRSDTQPHETNAYRNRTRFADLLMPMVCASFFLLCLV